jgi:hypothetical protein
MTLHILASEALLPQGEPSGEPPMRRRADFNVREELGRKGTVFLNRAGGLFLAACQRLRTRIGDDLWPDSRTAVVVGTSLGSLRSMSEYARDTLVEDRPYLVNPALFPTTVMNFVAGQTAIRFGFEGPNTTVAGGPLAFLQAVEVASRARDVDHVLVGCVEEATPHDGWMARLRGAGAWSEGAVVFLLSTRGGGRPIQRVQLGFEPDLEARHARLRSLVSDRPVLLSATAALGRSLGARDTSAGAWGSLGLARQLEAFDEDTPLALVGESPKGSFGFVALGHP